MMNYPSKTSNSKRGMILMVVLIVITVVAIIMPAYVSWTIWDQRSLLRQQRTEEALALARAGLSRAMLDLYLDTTSWLDGSINGNTITAPDFAQPNNFYLLYSGVLLTGSYNVQLRYLYNTATASFYDKRMWLKSTGTSTDSSASVELNQLVDWLVVRNITRSLDYTSLQLAVNDVIANAWNDDEIGVTSTTLAENVNISSIRFVINGCYDPAFQYRSCTDYLSVIQGNVNVTGTADVTMGGLTIQ